MKKRGDVRAVVGLQHLHIGGPLRARYVHLLEVSVDTVVGYCFGIATTVVVWNWWMGYDIVVTDNLVAGLAFAAVAIVRKYTIRRWSSNYIKRLYERPQKD